MEFFVKKRIKIVDSRNILLSLHRYNNVELKS
jgi:hypothetical protein